MCSHRQGRTICKQPHLGLKKLHISLIKLTRGCRPPYCCILKGLSGSIPHAGQFIVSVFQQIRPNGQKSNKKTAPVTGERRGTKAPADAGRFFRQDIFRTGAVNYIPLIGNNVSSAAFRVITLTTFSPKIPPRTKCSDTSFRIFSGGTPRVEATRFN